MHWGWQRRQRAWAGDQLGDSGPDGGRVAVRGLLRGESEQHQRVGGGSGNSSSSGPTLPSSWALAEAEAAWHPPRYSTYTCINAKFDDNFHAATCKFDNVCLNARTLQFEYYVDPELPDTPLVYTQTGVPLAQFSSHMLNLGHAHMDISEAMTWAPTAVRRPFPTVGQGVKWAEVPQALLAVIPAPLTTNFGHVMFDVLVPLFNLQHLFGIYTPEAQPIIMGTSNGSEEELRSTLGRMINTERVDMSLLRLHWQHNAEWLAEYAAAAAPDGGLLCYKNVLAGTGFLNRQMRATDSLPYRQAAMHNIGVVEVPQERPIVTIFNKKGRRMVENSEDVAATLRSRYGDRVEINMFDFGEHPGITMPQQLKLMSDTSILITPCGGIATVLAFMRPGATAIAMNYWHTGHNRSMQMEDNYYQHLEYLDIQYFPVTLEDYAATSDRPECENVKNGTRTQDAHYNLIGALVHCNVRLQAAGLRRMTHYVDNALKRWAARTGRYEVLEPLRQKQAKLTQLAAKQQQAQRQLLQGGGAVVQQRG